MLTNPVLYEEIRVDDKVFRVATITFDKNFPKSKADKKKRKNMDTQSSEFKAEDAASGRINAKEDASNERVYQDEIDCKIKLPTTISTNSQNKEDSKSESANEKLLNVNVKEALKPDIEINYTHFFCLPLNIKEFQQQMKIFKNEVYKSFDNTFDEYFVESQKFHLTMLMLRLDTPEKVKKIISLKSRITTEIDKITKGKPINIDFGDLTIFNASKDYNQGTLALRTKENRGLVMFRSIMDVLVRLLIQQELLKPEELSHVNLNNTTKKYELQEPHVTLMRVVEGSKLKGSQYNLKDVVDSYKRFGWSPVSIDNIKLCSRGTLSLTEFYGVDMQIDLK